jgi:hypothetical protein
MYDIIEVRANYEADKGKVASLIIHKFLGIKSNLFTTLFMLSSLWTGNVGITFEFEPHKVLFVRIKEENKCSFRMVNIFCILHKRMAFL